ncbi:MAG: integration host factor, actinobacterial type, partial [bacterium]|nr:integration host factor, actinobacterial type [bacterium]
AEVKAKLKMRSISLSDLLEQAESDEVVAGTKVLAVLESLPGMGKVRARKMMDEIGIADSRRIRGLGDQQRASLLARCGD